MLWLIAQFNILSSYATLTRVLRRAKTQHVDFSHFKHKEAVMVMSRRQFAVAYNKASVAVTGNKASPALITQGYEALSYLANLVESPKAVPVFTGTLSKHEGILKLDWDIEANRDGKLNPARGYYDPKKDGSARLAL
jgi:hypothetical protein